MATLKYEMTIKEKTGFTAEGLKAAMIGSLRDVSGKLIGFEYQPNCGDSILPGASKCVCEVSAPDLPVTAGIPTYQIIIGDIQTVANETYPYFEIVSIPVDKMEYQQ